ncbi:hypothetical protein ACFV23_42795 [Streptomyces sp. NPDC059627]
MGKNPIRALSVRLPVVVPSRVRPWTSERVFAVRAALPEPYRAMVDAGGDRGLRQGEIFGPPVDETGFLKGWLHVAYQVKLINGHPVFAPPKRGKMLRSNFNVHAWKPALVAAGVIPHPEPGGADRGVHQGTQPLPGAQ